MCRFFFVSITLCCCVFEFSVFFCVVLLCVCVGKCVPHKFMLFYWFYIVYSWGTILCVALSLQLIISGSLFLRIEEFFFQIYLV